MRFAWGVTLGVLALALTDCSDGVFECTTNASCPEVDSGARCEPTGFCSFPSGECSSGYAYGEYAGGLSGTCVDAPPATSTGDDTTTSGAPPLTSSSSDGIGPEDSTSTGSCVPCDNGEPCGAGEDCVSGVCDAGICRQAQSCAELPAGSPDGTYEIDLGGGVSELVECDMTTDGGGWTLIGSLVNDGERMWATGDVFQDETTFGDIASAQTADFKSPAWGAVAGQDLLVRTDEYTIGFAGVVAGSTFAGFVTERYARGECATEYEAGPPTFTEGLTREQAGTLGVIVQPLDDNSGGCFPDGNESVAVGLSTRDSWTHGLGNYPGSTLGWETHDLSLLQTETIMPVACDRTVYPCPPGGFQPSGSCYDATCKVAYATLWVR